MRRTANPRRGCCTPSVEFLDAGGQACLGGDQVAAMDGDLRDECVVVEQPCDVADVLDDGLSGFELRQRILPAAGGEARPAATK